MASSRIFRCDIVSAKEEIFSGAVEMVIATGTLGELGILPGHTPLLTGLRPGPVRLRISADSAGESAEEIFFASGGFMEVQPHLVTILADTAIRAEDLDEVAVKAAKEKAEMLLEGQAGEFQYGFAAAQLAEAVAQLHALDRYRNRKR